MTHKEYLAEENVKLRQKIEAIKQQANLVSIQLMSMAKELENLNDRIMQLHEVLGKGLYDEN